MKNKSVYFGTIILMGLFAVAIAVGTSCKKDKDEDTAKVRGCMDPTSLTYNPAAEEDDGSCVTPANVQRAVFIDFTALW
jgi:hypothetical protein